MQLPKSKTTPQRARDTGFFFMGAEKPYRRKTIDLSSSVRRRDRSA